MKKFNSNTRKEELARLNQCNNTLRNYFFVLVGLAVAALVAALLKFMIPSMLFLVALAVFRLTIHKKARNEYQQAITDAALTCSVGTRLDEFELSSKGGIGITREDILAAELVPVREGSDTYINFFQGIAGPSKGTEVSLNDTVLHQYQSAGQKGAAITCGVWMRFVLSKDSGRNLRLLSDGLLADDLREEFFAGLPALTRRDAEEAGFKEGLFLYEEGARNDVEPARSDVEPARSNVEPARSNVEPARNDAEPARSDVRPAVTGTAPSTVSSTAPKSAELLTFPPFPANFTSAVNRLARKTSVPFGLSLKGNVLNLFFKDRVLAPTCNLNAKPDESLLNLDPIPEFGDALSIAKNAPTV